MATEHSGEAVDSAGTSSDGSIADVQLSKQRLPPAGVTVKFRSNWDAKTT